MRSWRVFQYLARLLAACGVSPNVISAASLVVGVLAGAALAATTQLSGWSERLAWLAAACFIQLRLLANMLDGMMAIECGKVSPVGELYNEVPDRVSDLAVLIGAGYGHGGDVTLGYLAACAALFTAYVRALGKAVGAPNEFCGPMAKQQRMFLVTVAAVYAGLTPADWQPAWGEAPAWGILTAVLAVIFVGALVTAGRRLLRIAASLRKQAL